MSQRHESLIVWQRADDLCVAIHKLTHAHLPLFERFELASQLRRAAYSVAANIVEGSASESPAVRLRYLRIAVGSLAELGYGLHLAWRLGYLGDAAMRDFQRQTRQTAGPLHGLIRQVKREATTRKHD
jgi:four helix bundle protein